MNARSLSVVSDRPLRAIALIRVSKVGERGDDLISPDLQRQAIADYAHKRGARVVEWVEALDESASKTKSPWWARLDGAVAKVEAGTADLVLVWKVSRAARHRRQWAVALDRVEVAGGSVESATEGFDVTTSTGRLSRGILAELAAWESEVKSEQWKETHARRYRMGLPHTRLRVFGFVWDAETNSYRQDPATAPYVKQLYQMYVAGKGVAQLIRFLNDRGIRSGQGNPWGMSTLLRYMDSGWAAGLLPVGRQSGQFERRPGAQPPIIDQDLWDAYLARRNTTAKQAAKRRHPKYHLAGLPVCSRCGQTMVVYPYKNRKGQSERAFRCSTFQSTRSCQGVFVMGAVVDRAVRSWLHDLVGPVSDRAARQAAATAVGARFDDDLLLLTRELDALKLRGQRMLERLDAGIITDADYMTWRTERDSDAGRLQTAITAAKDERARVRAEPKAREIGDMLTAWDRLMIDRPTELNRWLAAIIRRIVVYPGRGSAEAKVRVIAAWEQDV